MIGVGTALYLAPEVLARARGHASHAKADMYALGVSLDRFIVIYSHSNRLSRIDCVF